MVDNIFSLIQREVRLALERESGLSKGIISLDEAIVDNRWWIIEMLAVTLQRYAQLWEAALLMSVYGLYIDPIRDVIEADCCHAHVPRSAALAVGPEDQWVLTFCIFCSEGEDYLVTLSPEAFEEALWEE